eukprot:CAMPEP_0175988602 /NCGR_PEP_ID=MMETSP0108-20121206/51335_1 /TAXON_ID=195067 ORGANISM="Goniomonas pacifica, Strain CCMP1869" /NCGR_SAMPLE_ID=MMETSP0108 /ASSEMBLY_ACC=CAM_ASM_000204 /LENGTH=159 /DNA_ID=CAMNT_0017319967 /DNA_START=88 /DNA_END=569 /DNA_ORIENTATION=+
MAGCMAKPSTEPTAMTPPIAIHESDAKGSDFDERNTLATKVFGEAGKEVHAVRLDEVLRPCGLGNAALDFKRIFLDCVVMIQQWKVGVHPRRRAVVQGKEHVRVPDEVDIHSGDENLRVSPPCALFGSLTLQEQESAIARQHNVPQAVEVSETGKTHCL